MAISVAVIAGGTSGEREVSLRSGKAVAEALQEAGYTVEIIDYSGPASLEGLSADVLFPVLHGEGGEDGTFQTACSKLGLKYVGSGEQASRLCFSKPNYLQFLRSRGLPVAAGAEVSLENFKSSPLKDKPFILKPIDGGSSLDIVIVRDVATLPEAQIETVFTKYNTLLLEQLIEGAEITVGVLGAEALPVIEIIPPADGEFDYENKYNGATQELCPPQHVSTSAQAAAQKLALETHNLTACRHYSRTDMIVQANDSLVVLETNTLPGMTDQSLFPKAAAQAGYTMPQLVDQLVQLVLKD